MKANELMIGDWVYDTTVKEPHQINAQDIFVAAEGILKPDAFEPLPLTEEILIKNGFKYDYDDEVCVADYQYIKVKGYQYQENDILIDYCNNHVAVINDLTNAEIRIDINYVHELQHAMKLCGIKKEIEI